MPFKRNEISNPKGRPKGSQNKDTKDIRAAFQLLIEKNLPKLEAWLTEIAKKNPAKAMDMVIKLSEYTIPKLKSIEIDLQTDFDKLSNEQLNDIIKGLK